MAKMTFKKALENSKKEQPDWGTYIHICRVLQESGCKRPEITTIFNKYMPKEEFNKSERVELIDYLVMISKPE